MERISIKTSFGDVSGIYDLPVAPKLVLILAHGAGAGMVHAFMESIAKGLSDEGIGVLRFDFPYMEQGKKSTGSPAKNIQVIGEVVQKATDDLPSVPLAIGGKSYGGRMCSHWLTTDARKTNKITGIIYYGFPLHAPGREGTDRAAHLYDIPTPQLFFQGTRDPLANYDLISQVVNRCQHAQMRTIANGDHSFKVRKKVTGLNMEDIMKKLVLDSKQWLYDRIS
jgi:hypothetical protein